MSVIVDTISVLHVEDESDFADMAASFLHREDDRLRIDTVTRASEALEQLAQDGFDCIVSDYQMPGMNGIEFLKTVREEYPDIPFILYTGKGSEEVASEAISAGVTDYLQKETGTEQFQLLANRIIDAVEHHGAQTAYQEIFESVPDGILIQEVDDGAFIDMNDQYAEMFGYEREEFFEAGFEAIHPGEPPYTVENARRQIQNVNDQGPQTFEWLGVRKAGETFWVEVHLTLARLYGDERLLAVVRDITDRKERQQELEETTQRYETVIEQSQDGIRIVQDGTIVFVNERLAEMVGASKDELVGAPADKIIAPEYEDIVRAHHTARMEGETPPDQYEVELDTTAGKTRHVELSVNRIQYEGEPASLSIIRDLTGRKEQEQEQ